MNRDPRNDPHANDVVRKKLPSGGLLTRTVIKVANNTVEYESQGIIRTCWITTWQDWCRDAEVVLEAA